LLLLVPWFRLVFIGVPVGVLLLASVTAKIFPATPRDFVPKVRISLLDRVQAWALKRSARKALAAEDTEGAFQAWSSASANDPADLDAIRGLLESAMRVDRPDRATGLVLQKGNWLVWLGQTNVSDLGVIAHSWLRCGLEDRVAGLIELGQEEAVGQHATLYAMSLFQAARWEEFASLMSTNAFVQRYAETLGKAGLKIEPEELPAPGFDLYCAGYLAAWGTPAVQVAALAELFAARQRFPVEVLAFDLEFRVHFYRGDSDAYRVTLRQLEALGRAGVRHHVGYWALLLSEGRRGVAQASAEGFALAPRNHVEAYQLAQIYLELGFFDKADSVLSRATETMGWIAGTVMLHSEVLTNARAWDRLRSLALRLRGNSGDMESPSGFAYYLEGVSSWHQGDMRAARRSFERMARLGLGDPKVALRVATGLLRLDAVSYAERILLPHREAQGENIEYLRLLNDCAVRLKNDSYLLNVAAVLYALQPNDVRTAINWAAALVIFRQQPDTAIILTRQLYADHPEDRGIVDNHIGALLLNRRVDEAEELLDRIDPNRLGVTSKAQYLLLKFEAQLQRGRLTEARAVATQITKSELFPVQVRWLEDRVRKLPKAP